MHLGIFAKAFPRPTLEETLDAVVAHGFTHIQFNMSCMGLPTLPDRLDEGSCVWIAQALHERGLTMAAISGTFNMSDPSDSRLEHNLRRLDVLAGACRWLDTRIITLCTGTLDAHDMWKWHLDNVRKSSWERLVLTMREAVKIADRHEVTLAFEPEINNVISSTMRARRLLDEMNSPWLKVVMDPVNLFLSHHVNLSRLYEVMNEAFDWLGSDIVLAHAKIPPRVEDNPEFRLRDIELVMQMATGGVRPEVLEQLRMTIVPDVVSQDLEQQLRWHIFHEPYLRGLAKLGFDGALIVHGLDEKDVPMAASLLATRLKDVSASS
jgi:sugar phosphate isomerase/epimerase